MQRRKCAKLLMCVVVCRELFQSRQREAMKEREVRHLLKQLKEAVEVPAAVEGLSERLPATAAIVDTETQGNDR
jgi:hypothetical protein